MARTPYLIGAAPTAVKRVLVDVSADNTIERQPKLIQGLLHRRTHRYLLRFGDGVTLHRQRSGLHVLFVDPHVQRPVTNIVRLAFEAIMSGEPADDASHALARGALETKSLAGIKLQPSALP